MMDCRIVISIAFLTVLNVAKCRHVGVVEYKSIEALNTILRGTVYESAFIKRRNLTLPNLSGKITRIFGVNFTWELNSLNGTALSTPFVQLTLSNSETGTVSITGVSVRLLGTFVIMKNGMPIFHQNMNGSACLESHVTFDEGAEILECTCKASCGGIQLNLVYNNIIPKFLQHGIDSALAEIIEKYLNQVACGYTRSLNSSQLIQNYASGGPLTDKLFIQFHLLKKQAIRNRGLISYFSGNVIPRHLDTFGDNGMVGTQLPDIVPYIQPKKSAQYLFSNYTLSTFVYTSIKLRLLDKWIYANSLSSAERTHFAINCSQVCFGTKFPQLKSRFSEQFVDAHLAIQDDVISYFTEDFIGINIKIRGDFVIGNYSFLTLSSDLSIEFGAYIENSTQTLKGKLMKFDIENLKIMASSVGDIPSDVLNWIFDVLKKVDLLKRTSGYLMEGIHLSNLEYRRGLPLVHVPYAIRDFEFKFYKDFMHVSANIYLN